MSQYGPPFDQSQTAPEPPRTSGLAIAALVCSLICCIPIITPVLGIVLGIAAAVSIKNNPARRGMGLAITAIVLGLVFLLIQIGIGTGSWSAFKQMRDAPYEALEPGFAGDYTELRQRFGPAGTTATDEEARIFIDELRSRHGNLLRSKFELQAFQQYQQQPGQTEFTLPWVLVFENEEVLAELTFRVDDQGADGDELIFYRVRVMDSSRGDLVFPPGTEAPDEAEAEDVAEEEELGTDEVLEEGIEEEEEEGDAARPEEEMETEEPSRAGGPRAP